MKPMRDPVRLADDASDSPSFLRTAIDAARAEVPDAERLERIARRLPPAAAAPPSSEPPPPALPPTAPGLSGKAIGVATAILLLGGAALWTAFRSAPAPAPAPASSASEIVLPAPAAPAASEAPPPEPEPEPSPALPAASSSAGADAARDRRPGAAASVAAPEGESEISILQRAHDALGASPARALAITNEHVARYPGGALVQEREVIAISALAAMGRSGEARARAQRFLAAFPRSAHRRRLEVLVGLPAGDDSSHKPEAGAPPTR